ncbi:hypothetical protein [Legionella sainthelensi]|nr:hypothetical protein [Legionella sainthelensi]
MTCKFYPLVLSGFFLANAAFATTPPILDKGWASLFKYALCI